MVMVAVVVAMNAAGVTTTVEGAETMIVAVAGIARVVTTVVTN
jgi:hypothetical protein